MSTVVKKLVKPAVKKLGKTAVKSADDIVESSVDDIAGASTGSLLDDLKDKMDVFFKQKKPVPEELINEADRMGANQLVKYARTHNEGGDTTAIRASKAAYRGGTKQDARDVRKTMLADQLKAEREAGEKAGKAIDERQAQETEEFVITQQGVQRSTKNLADKFREEGKTKGLSGDKLTAYIREQQDKELSKSALGSAPGIKAEDDFAESTGGFPYPFISSGQSMPATKRGYPDKMPPGLPKEEQEAWKANKKAAEAKAAKDEAARQREREGAAEAKARDQNAPRKPLSGWTTTYKPDDEIPSATNVITPSAAKPESEKLKTLQSEFSTTITPSEAPAAAAPKAKTKKAGKPTAAEPAAPAAEAATPEAPAVDFKGKSLSEVDAMVQSNPDLKQAAISYAKTKEKASWQNWAKRTEETPTEVSPASLPSSEAPITPSGAGPSKLSKLQKTAAPELAAPTTTQAPTPEIQTAVAASQKGKPRGTKMVTQQEATQTLTQEKAPTFVDQATGNPIKEADAVNLKNELQAAQQKGPEAVSQFSGKLKALGYGILGAGGYVLALKENNDANAIRNTFKDTLTGEAEDLVNKEPSTPQGVKTQVRGGGGAGGGGGGGEEPTTVVPGVPGKGPQVGPSGKVPAGPGTKAPAASTSPFKTDNPQAVYNFWTEIQKVAGPMSQLDEATQTRLKEQESNLSNTLKDATNAYNESIKQARSDNERREAIAAWGQIFELIGQSAVKYFAAREGKRLGQRIGSTLQLEKHDWSSDLNRSLEKLKLEMADAKERFGVAREEAQTGQKALAKERETLQEQAARRGEKFTDAAMRERAKALEGQQDLDRAMKIESMRLKRQEQAEIGRESREESRRTEREKKEEQRQEAATAKQTQQKYEKDKANYDKLKKAITKLAKTDNATNRGELTQAAAALGISDTDRDMMLQEATGAGAFNVQDVDIADEIADRYKPEKPSGQTQTGKVKVEFEGFEGEYKYLTPAQLAAAKEKYGSKVKVVE